MDYSDIINLPRPISKTHKHMSNSDRAAQFAPFAALTGYEQVISEVARTTTKRIELGTDQKEKINQTLICLKEEKDSHPHIKITYFVPDKKKNGGKYVTVKGEFLKFDSENKYLLLRDKTKIRIIDIFDIEIEESPVF
ncbi:MAG: hypothetical protein K5925_00730 [Bacilli bacterium]|nr:hypothetical protein [Bacilli bacterium]